MLSRTQTSTKAITSSIITIAFFSACGENQDGLPTHLSRFPADLNNASLQASGLYSDGWVRGIASVHLQQPNGKVVLSIQGTVPRIADTSFHTDAWLLLDDKEVVRRTVGIGDFNISVPVSSAPGERLVGVEFSASQELPAGDGRQVGARLKFLGFAPGSGAAPAHSSDVVRGSNIQLGNGWGVLETFHNQTFRWVDNDAQVSVTADQPGEVGVSLLAEPGPGVAGKPFLLKALDSSGRQIGAVPVRGRETVKLFVPVEAGKPTEFRLHVDGGGKPTPNDARILNFRAFRLEAELWGPSSP
jgi:hypothetical protein